jgi:hypothetical protein
MPAAKMMIGQASPIDIVPGEIADRNALSRVPVDYAGLNQPAQPLPEFQADLPRLQAIHGILFGGNFVQQRPDQRPILTVSPEALEQR